MAAKQPDWHARFAHAPSKDIGRTSKIVYGPNNTASNVTGSSEDCVENMSVRESRKTAKN